MLNLLLRTRWKRTESAQLWHFAKTSARSPGGDTRFGTVFTNVCLFRTRSQCISRHGCFWSTPIFTVAVFCKLFIAQKRSQNRKMCAEKPPFAIKGDYSNTFRTSPVADRKALPMSRYSWRNGLFLILPTDFVKIGTRSRKSYFPGQAQISRKIGTNTGKSGQ